MSQNTHRNPLGYEPRYPATSTPYSAYPSHSQVDQNSNNHPLTCQLMKPIESIDELLKQCQSYQQSSQSQKKRFYRNDHSRGDNVDELNNARHNDMLIAITKVSGRVEEFKKQILRAIDSSHVRSLHEIAGLKSAFDEILKEQQMMKQEINLITQQLRHGIPPETQQTSNEQSDDSIPLKKCDLGNPSIPDLRQSNEEVWLALSSLTCSSSDINQEESLKFNPTGIFLESEQPLLTEFKEEVDVRHSSVSFIAPNKRKFPVILNDITDTKRSLDIADGSDSDDYCSWKSRKE